MTDGSGRCGLTVEFPVVGDDAPAIVAASICRHRFAGRRATFTLDTTRVNA